MWPKQVPKGAIYSYIYSTMTAQDFFPQGYELPKKTGEFMKLEQWKNKFRVLQAPIVGYIDWDNSWEKKKPVRTATKQEPLNPNDDQQQPKHFRAFKVWNYKTGSVEILEITQWGIQNDIMNYIKTPEYWSALWYDIEITKTGEKKLTRYAVVAMPPKEASKDIIIASNKTPVNLEALFDNKNPFDTDELFN